MGVQVIGSGGQQVTAVGVPTKQVNAAAVRIVGGSGGTLDHNDTTNRDAVDAHPISAITGLQDALDALTGGGGSNLRVDLAIGDEHSDIDLDAAAPGDMPAVLVLDRASGNGVYEASVVDGWTLLDPQPTLVVADALVLWPDLGDPVLDTGVASIYDYSDTAGWQPVGSVPTLDGNPSQVWGPSGWVTPDGGASALADLTDVDVVSDPPAQDDVLAWDDTGGKWTPATLSGGADLSDTTPQALGTAAAGVGTEASRADHVHGMPTAADVGAAAASHTHNGTQVTIDASGFNGNLATTDNTLQQVAQKLDDLSVGGTVDVVSNVATNTILGRVTAGSGNSEELTAAQTRSLLGVSWQLLHDETLGSDAASKSYAVTGFSMVNVIFVGRSTRASTADTGRLTINGNTGSVYSTDSGSLTTYWTLGTLPATTTNTNRYAYAEANLQLFPGITKTGLGRGTGITSTATQSTLAAQRSYWSSITDAVTSIEVSMLVSNIAAGSRIIITGMP